MCAVSMKQESLILEVCTLGITGWFSKEERLPLDEVDNLMGYVKVITGFMVGCNFGNLEFFLSSTI